MLPFKTSNKPTESFTVKDGFGNEIDVPKYGCLTPNEALAISKVPVQDITWADYKLQVTAAFLSFRFKTTVTPEELAEQAGTQPMLDALYEFQNKEKLRWPPANIILSIQGETAESIGVEVAKNENGVLVKDPNNSNTYYVFSNLEAIPDGYTYREEHIFCEREEQEENAPKTQ